MATGEHRKELYAIVGKILRRDITETEHDMLKEVLVAHEREAARVVVTKVPNMPPQRYVFTCRECGKKTEGSGKVFKKDTIRSGSRLTKDETKKEEVSPVFTPPSQKPVFDDPLI